MTTIDDRHKLAPNLCRRETGGGYSSYSLRAVLSDEDEGVAEALRRDAEIEADPAKTISLPELDSQIQGRRG
jgi:hypothetical protein